MRICTKDLIAGVYKLSQSCLAYIYCGGQERGKSESAVSLTEKSFKVKKAEMSLSFPKFCEFLCSLKQ